MQMGKFAAMARRALVRALMLCGLSLSAGVGAAQDTSTLVRGALDRGALGLYPAGDFRLTSGACNDCVTIPQALWYFRDDVIAVPKNAPVDFSSQLSAQDDVRAWAAAHPIDADSKEPPLLWIGSPQVAEGVHLSAGGLAIVGPDGQRVPFAATEKIAANRSYYDASSVRHFADRSLRIRGRLSEGRFIARTIWPDDYALDFEHLAYQPLAAGETLETLVRADGGQPSAPLAARVLWQRDAAAQRHWAGRPVLAFMLNGAQGDDDEAHGGHFASATGAFGDQGQWGDWVVNNFYNLDSISEKGIIASMLSMDDYMADLNSGQSWYRPSFMLVAVLKQKRVASRFQEAVARVYNHFYRHDFSYRHASANCAGVNVETLRSLGWKIPEQGPTSRLQAVAGLPYMAIKDLSLDSGLKAYDYLVAERTDLYPFVAFEAIGRDLLQRLAAGGAGASAYERMLAQDIEALIYVRIPQFPSSRAMGQAPIASIDEYLGRVPQDKSKWKIVPVPPRPFPKGCQAPRRWRVPNRMPRNHQPITGSNVAEEAGSSQHRFKTSPKPLLPQHFRNSKIGTVLHARLPSFLAGGRRPFVIPFPYQNTNTVGTVGTLCFFRSPTISWGNRS